jgi:hypothetical protein
MQPKEMKQRLRAALAQPGQAMHEAVEMLAISRPMDPSGAALVLEREPGLGGLLARGPGAAGELAELITGLAQARRCLGCGTCCLTSSPTLYAEDLDRVTSGGLDRQALYALRPGERVSSAREGETKLLDRELIKLRERQTSPDASGGHAPGRAAYSWKRSAAEYMRSDPCNAGYWSAGAAGTRANWPAGRASLAPCCLAMMEPPWP